MSRAGREALLLLLLFVAVTVFASYITEHDSCERSLPVRAASNARKTVVDELVRFPPPTMPPDKVTRLKADAAKVPKLHQLDCGLPWPDTL
jgi:hypothetical protein